METGSYTFYLGVAPGVEPGEEHNGNGKGRLYLEYEPFSSVSKSLSNLPGVAGLGKVSCRERKTEEQINDFLRKLGFMDKEKEGGDFIKQFLHLSQVRDDKFVKWLRKLYVCVCICFLFFFTILIFFNLLFIIIYWYYFPIQTAYKLLELYQKLKDLGHPRYLSTGSVASIPCSTPKAEVDDKVQNTQQLLVSWTQEVTGLRSWYHWLLYLNMPKLLQLYHLLHQPGPVSSDTVDSIVHEVSFLAPNSPSEREKLQDGVEVLYVYVCA